MKYFIYLTFVFSFCSCNEVQKNDNLKKYVLNPSDLDHQCLDAIKQAKNDIANGKVVFTAHCSLYSCGLRQEKYLMKLCAEYNLNFEYEMFSDLYFEDQTQGCYGVYMENFIEKKYGKSFREDLLQKADSLLMISNDTIYSFECDVEAKIPAVSDVQLPINLKIPKGILGAVDSVEDDDSRFMDIGFFIDKSGNASGYFLGNFTDNTIDSEIKDEFYDLGVRRLKQIKIWESGMIKGHKVNTENSVRVHFYEHIATGVDNMIKNSNK